MLDTPDLSFSYLTELNSIFSKIECDRSVIEDALGSSTGISENNIMSYLGLVEQKTNELLTIQAFLNSKVTCHPTSSSVLHFLTYNTCCVCSTKLFSFSSYRMWKRSTIRKTWPHSFWVRIQSCFSRIWAANLQSTGGPLICSF